MKVFIAPLTLFALVLSSCTQNKNTSVFQNENYVRNFNSMNQNGTLITNLSNTSANIFIQAPHSFYDIGTKKIAADLSNELNATAFFYNSVHRKHIDLGKAKGLSENPLLKLSLDFTKKYENSKLVQLHGFSKKKHSSLKNEGFDAVISNGSKKPDAYVTQLTQCLNKALPFKFALYGKETQKLGGTKNIVKKYCHKNCQFVHLEFSKQLRDYMKENSNSISQLAACLKK